MLLCFTVWTMCRVDTKESSVLCIEMEELLNMLCKGASASFNKPTKTKPMNKICVGACKSLAAFANDRQGPAVATNTPDMPGEAKRRART